MQIHRYSTLRTHFLCQDLSINGQPLPRVSKLRAATLLVVLLSWIAIGASTMLFVKGLRLRRVERRFPELFHGTVARLFNLDTVVHGERHGGASTFYVANHTTYLDVFVLGGLIQGSFVAKSEVSGWPVFGQLAKLQNTVFLERRARRAVEQVGRLRNHLATKGSLIVFPEGTSTPGDYVAPFRSSLYRAAEGCMVQPVSVVYRDYDGQPMRPGARDRYAWYLPDANVAVPNRPFLPHFVSALGLRRCTVHVVFHEPFAMMEGQDRKWVAKQCEDAVRQGLNEHLVRYAPDDAAEIVVRA